MKTIPQKCQHGFQKNGNAHTLQQKYKPCFELSEHSVPRLHKAQYRNWHCGSERSGDSHMYHWEPRTGQSGLENKLQKYLWFFFVFVFSYAENFSVQNMPKSEVNRSAHAHMRACTHTTNCRQVQTLDWEYSLAYVFIQYTLFCLFCFAAVVMLTCLLGMFLLFLQWLVNHLFYHDNCHLHQHCHHPHHHHIHDSHPLHVTTDCYLFIYTG